MCYAKLQMHPNDVFSSSTRAGVCAAEKKAIDSGMHHQCAGVSVTQIASVAHCTMLQIPC
jgi:hypothetical protein